MPIGKVWIYRLLCVSFLCVCTVTDFSTEESNFARRFIGVQGREFHIFVNFAPPEALNWTNQPARHHRHDVHINDYPLAPEHIVRRVDVGSACVDIRQSPKTDVLVLNLLYVDNSTLPIAYKTIFLFSGVDICVCVSVCLFVCTSVYSSFYVCLYICLFFLLT